ncbi:MAG: PH domain-containing protein [Phycisphaerales bacterium JB059]
MITIHCDNCERELQLEDKDAGTKVACPHCGDINRVPAPAEARSPARADRASAAGLPPDEGPEATVRTLRPCMVRARPFSFTGVALVMIAGLVGVVMGLTGEDRGWLAILGGVIALLGFGVLFVWWLKTMSASLEVTNKRTILKRGILARSTSEVVHDNIRNIQIDQTFWQRVWGVGSIGISSSGQDGIEIQLGDLKNPNDIRKTIDLYRPL